MIRIGRLGRGTLEELASEAALRLCELSAPDAHVVTLSPEGQLAIERKNVAAEVDIIGCYFPNRHRIPRWIGLTREILEDLRHEVDVLRSQGEKV